MTAFKLPLDWIFSDVNFSLVVVNSFVLLNTHVSFMRSVSLTVIAHDSFGETDRTVFFIAVGTDRFFFFILYRR